MFDYFDTVKKNSRIIGSRPISIVFGLRVRNLNRRTIYCDLDFRVYQGRRRILVLKSFLCRLDVEDSELVRKNVVM